MAQHLGAAAASKRRKQNASQSLLRRLAEGDPSSSAAQQAARSRARPAPRQASAGANSRGFKRARAGGGEQNRSHQPLEDEIEDCVGDVDMTQRGGVVGTSRAAGEQEGKMKNDALAGEMCLDDELAG